MEDIAQQLAGILNDPGAMAQVQAVLQSLGGSLPGGGQAPPAKPASPPAPPPAPGPPPAPNPLGALAGLGGLGGLGGVPGGLDANLIGMLTKLAPMLSSMQQEDDTTRLLHALRPLLSEPRQKKLDEATKLLRLMRMLPLLKDAGLLGGLL